MFLGLKIGLSTHRIKSAQIREYRGLRKNDWDHLFIYLNMSCTHRYRGIVDSERVGNDGVMRLLMRDYEWLQSAVRLHYPVRPWVWYQLFIELTYKWRTWCWSDATYRESLANQYRIEWLKVALTYRYWRAPSMFLEIVVVFARKYYLGIPSETFYLNSQAILYYFT